MVAVLAHALGVIRRDIFGKPCDATPCDGGAVSRRVRDPHGRPADTDQVSQRRDHVGLPRGGGSGRAEAARHAAAGAARDYADVLSEDKDGDIYPLVKAADKLSAYFKMHGGAGRGQRGVSLGG